MSAIITHHYYYQVPKDIEQLPPEKVFTVLQERVRKSSENHSGILIDWTEKEIGSGLRFQVKVGHVRTIARILFGQLQFKPEPSLEPIFVPSYTAINFAHLAYFSRDAEGTGPYKDVDPNVVASLIAEVSGEVEQERSVGALDELRSQVEAESDPWYIPDFTEHMTRPLEREHRPLEREVLAIWSHVLSPTKFQASSRTIKLQQPTKELPRA
jgi:hypothetical protein